MSERSPVQVDVEARGAGGVRALHEQGVGRARHDRLQAVRDVAAAGNRHAVRPSANDDVGRLH